MKVNQTSSTNDLLWKLLAANEYDNGFAIFAQAQTKGKGQKGNIWLTEAGKNLTTSFFFSPKLSARKVFYLNMMATLAIRKALAEYGIDASIKWPNDILVNGKKIAGILVENQIQGEHIKKTVLGIGLNINQKEFPIDREITSIVQEINRETNIDDVFDTLYKHLDFFFDLLINKHFDILKKQYLKFMHQKDIWAEYSSTLRGRFTAIIQDVEENGQLKIQTVDGVEESYDMQTIRFL